MTTHQPSTPHPTRIVRLPQVLASTGSPVRLSPQQPQDLSGLPDAAITSGLKGRGAGVNPINRFERLGVEADMETLEALRHWDDGDDPCPSQACSRTMQSVKTQAERVASALVQVPTHVFDDTTRTVLNKVESPDLPFSITLNPYRGCEHGCVYCYARPGHEYLGLSSGLDFETKIFAKRNVASLLRTELIKPRWIMQDETGGPCVQPIMMAGVTDVYQPIERDLRLTRQCLEVMLEFRQPVTLITKSMLILRDIDLLRELARRNLVHVAISVTTLNVDLARAMEPRAAAPRARLNAIRTLAKAGIPVMAMTAPIIPGLNDEEIPELLREASRAGAAAAGYVLLRLPYQIKAVFLEWLQRVAADKAAKVEALIRETRDGELYQSAFFERGRGRGPMAMQVRSIFELFRKKNKLAQALPALDCRSFVAGKRDATASTARARDAGPGQLALFGEA